MKKSAHWSTTKAPGIVIALLVMMCGTLIAPCCTSAKLSHTTSALGEFETDDLLVNHRATVALSNSSPYNPIGLLAFQTVFNDWSPANLNLGTPLMVQAADNSGATITGIDATGAAIGDEHLICNFGGHEDASSVAFTNLDARSLAGNRIWVPSGGSRITPTSNLYKIGNDECRTVVYVQPDTTDPTFKVWVVKDGPTRFSDVVVASLQLFPSINPAALPASPATEDWDPTNTGATAYTCNFSPGPGTTPCSIDASDGSLHGASVIFVSTVTTTGATLGGLAYHGGPAGEVGPVKIIYNLGPGPLTIVDFDGGSLVENRFRITSTGLGTFTLQPERSAVFYHPSDQGSWKQVGHADSLFDGIQPVLVQEPSTLGNGATYEGVVINANQPPVAGTLTNIGVVLNASNGNAGNISLVNQAGDWNIGGNGLIQWLGTTAKQMADGHEIYIGTVPTIPAAGCGTLPANAGTDTVGVVTVGSVTTTCTVNFTHTMGLSPACQFYSTTGLALTQSAISPTSFTVSNAGLAGTTFHYRCDSLAN